MIESSSLGVRGVRHASNAAISTFWHPGAALNTSSTLIAPPSYRARPQKARAGVSWTGMET